MPNLDFQLVLDITVSHYLKKSIFMEKNQVIGKMTDIMIKRKPAMLKKCRIGHFSYYFIDKMLNWQIFIFLYEKKAELEFF
jgi:hypothetical protein